LDLKKARQFYLESASAVAAGQYREQQSEFRSKMGEIDSDSDHDSMDSDMDQLPEELTSEGHALGSVVSEACGLSDVYPRSKYPDARIDSYIFSPCGYSANGVIPSPDPSIPTTHYFTVHVTPEPHCSYASFETNVPGRQSGRETAEIVEQVVNIFRPGRFSVTLFEAKPTGSEMHPFRENYREVSGIKRVNRMDNIKGYRKVDRIVHDFDGYDLVFRCYERDDWKGSVSGKRHSI